MFFFFKQKTAYEMRISDWSSDVCSSDLSSLGGAAWNTYAQAQNTFDAINGIGPVWKEISGAFKGKGHNDEKGKAMAAMVAFLLAAIAILRSEERRVGKECVSTRRSRW